MNTGVIVTIRRTELPLTLALAISLVVLSVSTFDAWSESVTAGVHTVLFTVFVWLTWRAARYRSGISGLWLALAFVFNPVTFTHAGAEPWDTRTWSLLELNSSEWQFVSGAAAIAVALQLVALFTTDRSSSS